MSPVSQDALERALKALEAGVRGIQIDPPTPMEPALNEGSNWTTRVRVTHSSNPTPAEAVVSMVSLLRKRMPLVRWR